MTYSPSETIVKADRCKFSTYGYACGKHVEHGRYLCEEHAAAKCASCGQPATHGCDFCGQFVCGTPLCDECTFGTDSSKPAGAWGFINHIHVSKPEFADKHQNARLTAENAALARQAEALQRESALKDERIAALEAGLKPFASHQTADGLSGLGSLLYVPDEHPLMFNGLGDDIRVTVTVGDIRRARTLILGDEK